MSQSRTRELAQIRRAAAAVELRMRLARVLGSAPTVLTVSLAAAAVTLAARKAFPDVVPELRARQILIAIALGVVAALLRSLLRRLPPKAGTLALDRHHALSGRLTNAVSFIGVPEAKRSPLMEVAIDDACERAGALVPAKAAPIRMPKDLAVPLGAAIAVGLIAMLEVRIPRADIPHAKTIDALTMSPDDLELFKDAAKELAQRDQTPEVKAAVDRFNQLIEDIAAKRLDRTEAFRQMEAIERDLLDGAEADAKALDEALKDTAEELKKSSLSKPLGESLEKKDLDKAKTDLRQLAERVQDKKQKVDKAELERLRKALEKASQQQKEALAAINEKRAELQEQLLKKKKQPHDSPDAGAKDREEERLMQKKERELERLDREAEQKERVGRKLDKLDRDLAKAASDLMKELGASAEDLEQAAQDIEQMQKEEMSDKQKEELRQRLEELRELLRQQGQGGKQRMARMMRFGKRARGGQQGEKGEKGDQQGQGKDGQEGEDGEEGQGQDGKDGKDGEGKGQNQGKGQQWVLGPGGKKILVPGMGQGQGKDGQGQGQDGAGQDGKGNNPSGGDPGGHGVGSDHDGNVAGKRTDSKMGTSDVQAQGIDSQSGPSNSEVILSAAERGFKGGPYKKVFKDYHTVAEQQINKDQIPDGYRFYVHRYFQLIRPRD